MLKPLATTTAALSLLSMTLLGGVLTGCENDNTTSQSSSTPAPNNGPSNNDSDSGNSFDLNITGDDGSVSYESDEDSSNTSIDINAE